MTDAPNTSTYLLASPDSTELPNSRVVAADATTGLAWRSEGSGPDAIYQLTTLGNLVKVYNYNSNGLISFNPDTQSFVPRSIGGSGSITVTNGDGKDGNPTIDVVPSSTVQLLKTSLNGSARATRSGIDFESTANLSISITDDAINDTAHVQFTVTGLTGGTVTSVNIESPEGTLDVSGGPIETEGTFLLDLPVQPNLEPGTYSKPLVTFNEFGLATNASNGEGPSGNNVTDITSAMSPYYIQDEDFLINVIQVNTDEQMSVVLPFSTKGREIIIKDTSDNLSNLNPIHVTTQSELLPVLEITGPMLLEGAMDIVCLDGMTNVFALSLTDMGIFDLEEGASIDGPLVDIAGLIDGDRYYNIEIGYGSLTLFGLSNTQDHWGIV